MVESATDSRRTSRITRFEVKPTALSSPISPTRSRTDCAIVFPATSRMVKNTAPRIEVTMSPMLPIWLAKPAANAPSGSLLVSASELRNRASMASAVSAARSGSAIRTMYQPTVPRPKLRASSKKS